MDEPETIADIDAALTYATSQHWRDWYTYIDRLLDQRNEANHGTQSDLVNR
jgi:hypothetical protein